MPAYHRLHKTAMWGFCNYTNKLGASFKTQQTGLETQALQPKQLQQKPSIRMELVTQPSLSPTSYPQPTTPESSPQHTPTPV